jgi:two-component system, NarL family, invasion response regulator UvrY
MIRIGIVDDNTRILELISREINSDKNLELIISVLNGYDFVFYCQTNKILPDIAVVDVNMDKFDGVLLTDYISTYFPSIKVIALSMYASKLTVEDMLSVGAFAFITKINISHLKEVIYHVMDGGIFIDPITEVDGSIRQELILFKKEQLDKSKHLQLTKSEVKLIALNASGIENSEIANLMFIRRKSVDNLFSNVSKKLNVKSRFVLALVSIRLGLVKIARISKKVYDEKK